MENFLIMESGHKKVNPKMENGLSGQVAIGYMDKWKIGQSWTQVTMWTKCLCGQSGLEDASKEATWRV